MPALFPRWSNTLLELGACVVALSLVAAATAPMAFVRTPYATGQADPRVQPVKFDHRHHVRDDGINCLYCHSGATRAAPAGVPSTALCMNCHSQIWTSSPELSRVRDSYFSGAAIPWERVHRMPDFTFFNHSIH